MGSIGSDEKINNVYDQVFLLDKGQMTRTFSMPKFLDNLSFLMVWPAVIITRICAKTNDQRLLEELQMLKELKMLGELEHLESQLSDEANIPSTPKWIFDKEMIAIIDMINDRKNFLWKILKTLYRDNSNVDDFDELICKYYILCFALLYYDETEEKKILLFQDDMVEYLLQANKDQAALYHLSCISLYILMDTDFNFYKINKEPETVNSSNWSIHNSYDECCLKSLEKEKNEDNVSEDRYCFDGSNVESGNFREIICSQIFKTADEISLLYNELIYDISQLHLDLPRFYDNDPVRYSKLFSDIKNHDKFSSILYQYNDLFKYAQALPSELNKKYNTEMLKNHIKTLKDIGKKQKKEIDLYPEIEEVLLKVIEEVSKLRQLFKKEEFNECSCSLTTSIEYFQNLDSSEFPLLKKLEPEEIFSKDIKAYKEKLKDEKNENLIFTEMWERNICERILPVIKLNLENTPYGKPVPGRELYNILKKTTSR